MKQLCIQLQPELSPGLDVVESLARLSHLVASAQITKYDDDGEYFHVDYKTNDLSGLWMLIREELRNVTGLAEAAIIVCEGEHGWDDYLLLHNIDPNAPLDKLG